ncbi:discoidin domain-containing protein [Clostridium sp. LIBA-8841]|uniref:discoidin domain-containing protein n=1 Tax=Clostridium sp. LIBA-8841 TaxID=2987530 RepID=UPI002AC60ABB|nr:discoidin domain-containing protein [Clostridium sp. LIBA-8841]MDZ5252256.1 discoidin domain-containing protein [Clostridium sp. LIBA-8841]
MLKNREKIKRLIACGIVASIVSANGLSVFATEVNKTDKVNLALNKRAVASSREVSDKWGAELITDGIKDKSSDPNAKPGNSRWASERSVPQWVYIDFEESTTFDQVDILWDGAYSRNYKLEVSDDAETWREVYTTSDGKGNQESINLEEDVTANYLRVSCEDTAHEWGNVSIYEVEVYDNEGETAPPETETGVNIALNKTATASASETNALTPDKVVDGDTSSKTSRWSSGAFSNGAKQWITIDLEKESTFDKVRLFWEAANAKVYEVQTSNDNENWTTIHRNEAGKGGVETIELSEKQNARYVRVFCEKNNPEVWSSVSLYEVEIYNGEIPSSSNIDEVVSSIEVPTINKGDSELQMPEVPQGYEISFIGADYSQIINDDMTINEPLVDTTVIVDFEIKKGNEKRETAGIEINVPGKYSGSLGSNSKPEVVPTLREWVGTDGNFTITDSSRIVIDPSYENELSKTSSEFKADYEEIVKKPIEIVYSNSPKKGDFYFTLDCEDKSIGEEGYYMYVADYLKVEATHDTGAFYSTRSILQILKQNGDNIPMGIVRDFPRYENRGFMLDVGRKFFTMDYLEQFMEAMSWYKMNNFQVHLSDNYIWTTEENWETAYAAFRLENDTYPGLTATDGSYTKDEFRDFIEMSDDHGVEIIPEIDVPAHSLAFTRYNPSLALGTGGDATYLDVGNPEVYDFVDGLFDEYLGGEDPVFSDQDFHIGTDEYKGAPEKKEEFRAFTDRYLKKVRDEYGRRPRLWGSLDVFPGETPVTSDGALMNIWYRGYADARNMINQGYDILNTQDADLYIVPEAGYYNNYLNTKFLYNEWEPRRFASNYKLPAGHPQLKGGMFAVWNDMIDEKANGISERDIYDRSFQAAQVLSEKMWAAPDSETSFDEFKERVDKVSDVPGSNLTYDVESKTETVIDYDFEGDISENITDNSGNEYDATGRNVESVEGKEGKGIKLNGGESYIDTPVDNKGLDYTVSMWVKKDANGDYSEQILSESNTGLLKACQKETGNVGFSREGYDYSFNYKLPEGEWVELTFVGKLNQTSLYVNGELTDVIKKSNGGKVGTFILPLDRIGSSTNSFKGSIDEITVKDGAVKITDPTVIPQEQMKATASSEHPNIGTEGLAEFAIDGDESTIWHTKWSPVDKLPQHITLDLGGSYDINKFTYMPRQNGLNGSISEYELQVSTDGENFTKVAEGNWTADNSTKVLNFDAVNATHVRLVAKAGHGGFASAAELNVHKSLEVPEEIVGESFLTLPESVKVNENFDIFLGANEIKEDLSAYAAEFTLKYNQEIFDLVEVTNGIEGVFVNHKEIEPGVVKIVAASLGKPIENATNLIKATLTPKSESEKETFEIISANLGDGESGNVHELGLTSGEVEVSKGSVDIIINPVRNFVASEVNKKDVTVTWEAPETTEGLEGYILYKDGKKVGEVGADETTYQFKGLSRHTIYNFKIAAKYSNGEISSKESITLRTAR